MKVIGVVVHRTDPLVFSKPQRVAYAMLDLGQDLWRRLFAGRERQQQMIGLIGLRAVVELLGAHNGKGQLVRRYGGAVGDRDRSDPLLLAVGVADVADKGGVVARLRLALADGARDHSGAPDVPRSRDRTGEPWRTRPCWISYICTWLAWIAGRSLPMYATA